MIVLRDAWRYLTTSSSWTGDNALLDRMAEQLLLTVTALLVAVVVALPLALWLGHVGRGGFLAVNISNVGRAVPTFALLAVLVKLDWPGTGTFGPYGRAGLATLMALVAFALPPLVTNAYVAMREVPAEMREVADGMGMTAWQKFVRVELPLAMPLVVSGVRLALVQVWATATIAALVAGPGLGRIITDSFVRTQYGRGIGAALVVAAVALVLEVLMAGLARLVVPTPVSRGSTNRGRASVEESKVPG
ncbi:ABC transporter permease [Nocardioides sp. MH1]|uniref:ABC transporter permease n=1 Tax=Nocardioides sp. MH1 TaxID=3242490 RepID=UPI003522C7D2